MSCLVNEKSSPQKRQSLSQRRGANRVASLQRDEELWAHIEECGIPPFFALSWFITWFSHNLQELHHISRLFDVLMASHPLMPIYIAAIIMEVRLLVHVADFALPHINAVYIVCQYNQ